MESPIIVERTVEAFAEAERSPCEDRMARPKRAKENLVGNMRYLRQSARVNSSNEGI
jgi:hypothetical protein